MRDADVVVLRGRRHPPAAASSRRRCSRCCGASGRGCSRPSTRVDVAAETRRSGRGGVEPRRSRPGARCAVSAETGAGVAELRGAIAAPAAGVSLPLPGGGALQPAGPLLRVGARPGERLRAVRGGDARTAWRSGWTSSARSRIRCSSARPSSWSGAPRRESSSARAGGPSATWATLARGKIEAFLGRRVYLDLWVKVLPALAQGPARAATARLPRLEHPGGAEMLDAELLDLLVCPQLQGRRSSTREEPPALVCYACAAALPGARRHPHPADRRG